MPKYRLDLTLTQAGRDNNNPEPVSVRRAAAVAAAERWHVTGPGGDVITNHITEGPNGRTWIVEGSDSNVDNMIEEWEINGNVTVSKSPLGP